MKKTTVMLFLILLTAAITSCKKDSSDDAANNPTSYPDKIVLSDLQTYNDSVVLNWTKLTNKNFYSYYIIRRNYKATDPNSYTYSDIIQEIHTASLVRFVDRSVPVASYLEYQVVGLIYDSIHPVNNPVYSNVKSFERPDIKTFYLNPTDVLPDIPNHRFYVIGADSGKISLVDYTSKSIVKSIKTFSTNGYSALGTFNGVKELYVPRNDGWVFIYNAETLDKIDQISAGTNSGAVLWNNGQLFVFNSSSYYSDLKVIDRATKSLITSISGIDFMRPRMVPGSTTKIFGVTSGYSSSGDLYYFEFDASGHLVSQESNYINYPSDYHSFEIFPDGQHFITSYAGTIFDSDLNYVIQLPFGDYEYSGFVFDAASSRIVAGCRNYKCMVAYSNPGYSELQNYHTTGYPAFIFNDNNTVISLSSTTSYGSYSYSRNFIIETITLSK